MNKTAAGLIVFHPVARAERNSSAFEKFTALHWVMA
jgi:hypothetical protein